MCHGLCTEIFLNSALHVIKLTHGISMCKSTFCMKKGMNSINLKESKKKCCAQLCCINNANSPHLGPLPIGGMLSVEVFLRDPSPYLREFWRKPQKIPKS